LRHVEEAKAKEVEIPETPRTKVEEEEEEEEEATQEPPSA
jgi:hypothetical protein